MKEELDPYYTALHCSHEGFPIKPLVSGSHSDDACASSDPIFNHERWTGQFAGCPVALPTGTASGTLAVKIAKPCAQHSSNGFSSIFQLQCMHGTLPQTCSFEDEQHWTLIYECPDDFTASGEVTIAPGVIVYGNGASVIIPNEPATRLLKFSQDSRLTRDALVMAPDWIVSKAILAEILAATAELISAA